MQHWGGHGKSREFCMPTQRTMSSNSSLENTVTQKAPLKTWNMIYISSFLFLTGFHNATRVLGEILHVKWGEMPRDSYAEIKYLENMRFLCKISHTILESRGNFWKIKGELKNVNRRTAKSITELQSMTISIKLGMLEEILSGKWESIMCL